MKLVTEINFAFIFRRHVIVNNIFAHVDLPQPASSEKSPQSLTPLQTKNAGRQRVLLHVNIIAEQVGGAAVRANTQHLVFVTARRMCIALYMLLTGIILPVCCLSVCPSHSGIVSK